MFYWLLLIAWSKRLRGIVLPEDEMALDDAVAQLPETLRVLYDEAKKSKDQNKAEEVMKELDKVYERAMMDKDLLDIDCRDTKEHYAVELQGSRNFKIQSESELTRVDNRMEHVQMKLDDLQAQLQDHIQRYHDHRRMCEMHRHQSEKELALLEKDLPVSKTLRETASKGCASVALVECQQPDGTMTLKFEDSVLQKVAGSLIPEVQQFLALNLERAVYGRNPIPFPLLSLHSEAHFERTYAHKAELCTKVTAPPCEAFVDVMATFVGNVEDAIDDLRQKSVTEAKECQDSVALDEEAIQVLREDIGDLNTELADAVREKQEAETEKSRRVVHWEELSHEAQTAVGSCSGQLEDIEATLCSVRKLRKDLLKLELAVDVPFIGDCIVTDWVRGPCTAECHGGHQNITRDVVADAPLCPPLVVNRECNTGPCPQHCEMGKWGSWSKCSKACGGGTQARTRDIHVEAANGGLPCGDTVQERLCNHQSCDMPCVLSEWTPWSGCSRSCLKGQQVRHRQVLVASRGLGHCPHESSYERRETRRCNDFECANPVPACNTTIDVVVALDSSGSVGADGFAETVGFLTEFVPRFEPTAHIALVNFATDAELVAPLGASDAAVKAISTLAWKKTNTNTAEALGVSSELLLSGRKEAQAITLVITDGMPYSKYATTMMVDRLKNKGSRVMFLTVGEAINKRVVRQWASWPWFDNIQKVASYDALNSTIATRVLAKMCPVLA